MREIKFRAWVDNHMGEPFAPLDSVFLATGGTFPKGTIFMQYTGLKDKNGKEIYEGDINRDHGVIIWNESDASFVWEYKDIEVMPMGEENDWCNIVGNIYENLIP